MTLTFHPLVSTIIKLLEQNHYWFETFIHQPVRTSQEAAKIRDGYTLAQGAKALIVRIKKSKKDKFFVMLVLPGDKKFAKDKVEALFEAKDIRFATESEVIALTQGVKPGGVPPFGNLFNLKVVTDPLLLENQRIIFNAGDQSFSIGMYSADFVKLVKPLIREII